jgi:hypothetical protein
MTERDDIARLTTEICRLCRGKPSHTVFDALISTMLTVIVGRRAMSVRRLRSLQKPVAICLANRRPSPRVGAHCGSGSINCARAHANQP